MSRTPSGDFSLERPSAGGSRRKPANSSGGGSGSGGGSSSSSAAPNVVVVDVASKLNPAFLALSRLKSDRQQQQQQQQQQAAAEQPIDRPIACTNESRSGSTSVQTRVQSMS